MSLSCYVGMMLWIENRYSYGLKILSGAGSFRHKIKWERKALCVAITDSLVLKNTTRKTSTWWSYHDHFPKFTSTTQLTDRRYFCRTLYVLYFYSLYCLTFGSSRLKLLYSNTIYLNCWKPLSREFSLCEYFNNHDETKKCPFRPRIRNHCNQSVKHTDFYAVKLIKDVYILN